MAAKTSVKILGSALKPKLYQDLIVQLNRDLLLGGIDLKIALNTTPNNLIKQLTKLLKELVQYNYQTFNQFMYTLDVSEEKLHNLKQTNLELLAPELARLVLERLLQKVILKAQFKT